VARLHLLHFLCDRDQPFLKKQQSHFGLFFILISFPSQQERNASVKSRRHNKQEPSKENHGLPSRPTSGQLAQQQAGFDE
jgi:hypothetical protein